MGYVDEVLEKVRTKNAAEPEFLQAVEEVLDSLLQHDLLIRCRN
jgi:glutamate dehydrogenase (NADP+)